MTTPPALPSLPGLAWSRHKKPGFSTRVASHSSGREVRVALMSYPLYEFEALYNGLSSASSPAAAQGGLGASSLQSLMGLFLQLRGQAGVFLYADPDDNTVTGQNIGIGDGATQSFVMGRTLGGFNEPVSWITSIADVYFNGIVQSTVNYVLEQPNTLAFYNAPGAGVAITADFTYAFQCRFLDDRMDFEEFMSSLWKLDKMRFRSITANTTPAAPPPWYDNYAIGGVNPSIFADFTTEGGSNRYLYNGSTYGSFAALLTALSGTFSRSSSAFYTSSSGLLTGASSNVPRFDYDPVALTSRGILLEGASTNLAPYSNTLSSWSTGYAGTPLQNATGPDCVANSAWTISGNGTYGLASPAPSTFSGTVTASIWAKAGTTPWIFFRVNSAYAWFNVSTGTVGTVQTGLSNASVVAFPNGWYRISVSYPSCPSTGDFWVGVANSNGTFNAVSSATNVIVWGGQLENLSFASSYIPTTSSTATRAADNLYIPWTATTFTARVKAAMTAEADNGRLLGAGSGGLLYEAAGPNAATNNGSNTLSTGVNAWASQNIAVIGGSPTGRVLAANGNTAASDSHALVASAPSDIYVGQESGGGNYGYGDFAQIGLWNVAATAAQAAALSGMT